MKKIVSVLVIGFMMTPAFALTPAGQSRRSMSQQMAAAPAPRATASVNQLNAMAQISHADDVVAKPSVRVEPMMPENTKDNRDKERAACLGNNIGVGNTFVWASMYSNTSDYATMIEDTENPENNVCFVRVEMRSADNRVDMSIAKPRYYEMGRAIVCGDWVDENVMRENILDAKKKGRTWGTVAGAVGGAGIGVGAMELFGNKLIGGKVQGQKDLEGTELIRSQLLVWKTEDVAKYNEFKKNLELLRDACSELNDAADGCADYKELIQEFAQSDA